MWIVQGRPLFKEVFIQGSLPVTSRSCKGHLPGFRQGRFSGNEGEESFDL